MIKRFPKLIVTNAILFCAIAADAQFGRPKSGLQPMKSAVDLIKKQAPLRVNQALLAKISQGDVHVIISLAKQRAYLMVGEEIVVDSPISSANRATLRPAGTCTSWKKIRTITRLFMVTLLIARGVLFARA